MFTPSQKTIAYSFRMQLLLYLSATFTLALASCPDLPPMNPFDINRFTGLWYNQYSRNTPLEAGSCMVSYYSYDTDSQVMGINTTYKTLFGSTENMSATAVFVNSSTEATFKLTYKTPIGNMDFNLKFLTTDYKNYAIMYSCMNILSQAYQSSWIVTRERVVSEKTLESIKEAMNSVHKIGGPSFQQMKKNAQENCD